MVMQFLGKIAEVAEKAVEQGTKVSLEKTSAEIMPEKADVKTSPEKTEPKISPEKAEANLMPTELSERTEANQMPKELGEGESHEGASFQRPEIAIESKIGEDIQDGKGSNKAVESGQDVKNKFEKTGLLPRSGGIWTGEPGNSEFKPIRDIEPGDRNGTNPEHKTWGEILDKYEIDGIKFEENAPDFSEVAKGEVQIDDFSEDRGANFDQADEKMAEQRGCTPEEVYQWRKENKYTWHECKDCQTMQKVPTEVHGNIPHSGGISECKARNNVE